MENITTDHQVITLPGFRFHPTEEELVDYYLKETALGNILHSNIIGFLNIYKYQPWDLPGMANIGEREWYFFVPTEKRYRYGGKANRTTETGYWKATGSGRHVRSLEDPKKIVGLKKIFVFYTGKAPKGSRTDWVMNEYTLISAATASIISTEDLVLCKIYRKAASIKELEKRAEEHAMTSHILSSYDAQNNFDVPLFQHEQYVESAAHQKAADSEPIMESVGLRPIDEIQLPVDPGLDCTKLDSIEAQSVPDIHILFDSLFSTSFPM